MADQDKPKSKRRLRPSSSETVRERAENVQQKQVTDQNVKQHGFWYGFFLPLRTVGRGFSWLLKRVMPPYIKNSWREVRLVTWPKRRESWSLTGAVMIFAIIFGAIIALLDFGLDKLFKEILLK